MDIGSNLQSLVTLVSLLSGSVFQDPPLAPVSDDNRTVSYYAEYEFPKVQIERSNALARDSFPEDFYFGFSTSAYQTEGAWNVSGKGMSVWDYLTHTPNHILDGINGDVAADFYHKYKEDIKLAKDLGSKMFKISLSWSRILPSGYDNYVSPDGIRFYSDVIDEIIKNGMEPMVVLYHWDLPNNLQQLGGWTNSLMPYFFQQYAKTAFTFLGDKVKYWVTMNEPNYLCFAGYGSLFVPGLNQSGIADYMCMHNILLAHAKAYNMYTDLFRQEQKGKIGLTHGFLWPIPENPYLEEDVLMAERSYQWFNEWMLHPLLSVTGDYPRIMIKDIARKSYEQGFEYSRLPSFTETEIYEVLGAIDFLGVNFYYGVMARAHVADRNEVHFTNDIGIARQKSGMLKYVENIPWALEKLLNRLNNDYVLPEIIITENGYDGRGNIADVKTAVFYHDHISVILRAMQRGILIRGYLAWTLVDCFEWLRGYRPKFGAFFVDYTNQNLTRYPKLSSTLLSSIYTNRTLPDVNKFISRQYVKEFLDLLASRSRSSTKKSQ